MSRRRQALAGAVGLLWLGGCVGHLEFDPQLDAGAAAPAGNGGGNNNVAGGNNNTISGGGSGGSSGSNSGQTTGGSGGAPVPAGGSDGGWGATTDAGGNAGSTGSDAGAAGADAGTAAAVACPTGVNVLTDVFAARCGGCHGATAPTKNLDLVSAGLGARMVGKLSSCKSQPLIATALTAGKPTGLLFEKLAGAVTDCGVQMPAGGTPLSAAEIACVSDWAVAAIAKVTGK